MLESLACDLLNEYFGAYVENLNRENLSLQVWKGEVQLERLALKQTALEDLNLPIDVRTGHIEKLSMRIPWRNLKGEPVVINIKGLYVLANPRVQVEYNEATERQRQQALKERALAEFEALKLKQLQKVEEQKGDNFNATLVGKIVNNLQLVIEDVHIRYEDHTSTPETPIAVGVTLGSFTARSTSSDWQIKFIQGDNPISYKLLDLQGLALYYETNAKMTRAKDMKLQDFFAMMAVGIARSAGGGQPFILQPVNCEAKVVLNNSRPLDLAMPRQAVTISLPAIPIHLQDAQYQSCMQVLEAFSRARRGERYRKFRPQPVAGESRLNVRQLWGFALASVLADIKERNRRYTWEYFMQRRKDRIAYVAAYVQKKTLTALPPEVTKTLQALEVRLPFEDIRYFRCLGDVKLRNERPLREAAAKRAREERQAAANQAQGGSWFSGLWGPDPKPGQAAGAGPSTEQPDAAKDAAPAPTALALSSEQRQELFAAIGYVGEQDEPDSMLPPSYVSSRLAFTLQKGSFALTTLQPNRTKATLVEVEFSDLVATLSHRAGSSSLLTEISLGSLALHDKITRNAQFPAIVRPVSEQPVGLAALLDTPKGHSRKPSNSGGWKEALFSMVHETNPLNSKADAYVAIHSKALFLVYNPTVVKKVVKFFTPPEDLQVAHDLAAAAQRQMETTSLSVWTALYSRSVYDVSIVIEAPNIVIPERADDPNCAVAVLDLGQLKVTSVPRASHKRRHKRTHTNSADDDFVTPAETPSELEGLAGGSAKDIEQFLYDRFVLELNDAQLLCSRVSAPWQAAMQKATSSMHVVDKFSMRLDMAKCITKALQEYPNTKLTANLPSLEVHASDQKIADVASCFVGAFGRSGSGSRGAGEASLSAHQSVLEGEATADDDQLFAQLLMDREIQPKVRNPATVLVQATFEMPHILVTLHSSHDVSGVLEAEGVEGLERGRALIGLEVTGVAMSFVQRYYDTKASFTVESVEIPDLQGLGGPQFPCLLTSRDQRSKEVAAAGQELPVPLGLWAKHHTSLASLDQPMGPPSDTDTRLITFTWHRIDPQHPNFATVHEGCEVQMDVSFNTLTMHVVPDTIAEVRAFAQALSDTFDRLTLGPSPAVSRTASLDHPADPPGSDFGDLADHQAGPAHQPRIRLTAQFKQLGVTLVQNKQPVLSADMGGFQVAMDSSADSLQLKGKVMGICVLDRTPEGRRYRNVVSNYAKEVLSFDITKHNKGSTDHRAEEMTVHVRTGDLKVFYTERFYQLVTVYFANFRYAYRLYQAAASAAAGAAASLTKSVEWAKLDVVVDSPMIVLPRNATSDQVLVGNLGRLTVSNQLAAHPVTGQTADVMTVGLSEMALYTGLRDNVVDRLASMGPASPGLPGGLQASNYMLGQPMVHDITFDLVVTSLVEAPQSTDIAPREISGKISDIQITLSQKGYQQLMGTIDENLMYQLPGSEMASLGLLADPDSTSVDTMSVASELGSEDVEGLVMTVDIRVPHVRLLLRTEAPDQPGAPLQRNAAGLQQGLALREQDLCEVVAEGFSLAVRRRAHDFVADVALQGLRITDLLQETDKENAVMATDQPDLGSIGGLPGSDGGDGEERHSLVAIRVSKADALSPVFQQQNGLGRVVDIRLHDVGLLVNMETWVLLIDFFLSNENSALPPSPAKGQSAGGPGRAGEQPAKKTARDAEVWNISARTLILTLNKGRRQLARFDARKIEFTAHLGGLYDDGGVRFDGKLGWLRVLDLTPRGALYSTVFITSGGEMLSFSYTKLGNAAPVGKQLQDLDHPAKVGDSLLRLKIGEAYVVYCRRFIDQLFEYIFQFQHLQDLLSYLRTGQAQQDGLRFYYSISLLNPGIVVPASSTSSLALIAYLGNITVNNSYVNRPPQQDGQGGPDSYWLDCIAVDMADMALWSARLRPTMLHGHMTVFNDGAAGVAGSRRRTTDTAEGWGDLRVVSVQRIIRECSSSLTVERRLAPSGTPESLLGPQYRVQWRVADGGVVLDDLSHAIVRALLEAGNLAETPMPDDPVQLAPAQQPPSMDSGQVADEQMLVFELQMSGMTLEVTEYAYDKTVTSWGVGSELPSVGLARFTLFESTVCFTSTVGGQKTTDFKCARLTAVDLRSEARGSAHPNVLTDEVESYLTADHTLIALDDEPSLRVTYLAQPTGQASLAVHLNKSRLLWVWDFFMELKTYLLEPLNIYTDCANGPTLALRRDPLTPPTASQSAGAVDSGPLRQLTMGNRFECTISLKKPELVFIYDLSSASSCSVAVQCDADLSLDMAPHASSGAMWWRLNLANVFCYSYWIGHKDTMVALLDRCKFELTWREQLRMEDTRTEASGDVGLLVGESPAAGPRAVVERDFRLEFQDEPVKLRLSPQEVDLLQRIVDVHFMPKAPQAQPLSAGGLAAMGISDKLLFLNAEGYEKAWCKAALDRNNEDLDNAVMWLSYSYDPDAPPPDPGAHPSIGPVVPVRAMLSEDFTLNRAQAGQHHTQDPQPPAPEDVAGAEGPQVTYREMFTLCTQQPLTVQLYMAKNGLVIPLVEFTNENTLLDVRNWSSSTNLLYQATVRLDFYDSHIAAWVPLVEHFTVEVKHVDHKEKGRIIRMRNFGTDQGPLMVTVSSHMLGAVDMAYQSLSAIDSAYWSKPQDRLDYKPFSLDNRTGVPLDFWPVGMEGRRFEVAAGASQQFDLGPARDLLGPGQQAGPQQTTVEIKLLGYRPLKPIEVSRTGHFGLLACPEQQGNQRDHVLVNLEIHNNRKTIEVRSMVQLANRMPVDLALCLEHPATKDWTEPIVVCAGEVYPLPLQYVRSNFKVRPEVPGMHYNYCNALVQDAADIKFLKCFRQGEAGPGAYNMILHTETRKQQVTQFVSYNLQPPLRLENLCPCDMIVMLGTEESLHVGSGEVREVVGVDFSKEVTARIKLIDEPYNASPVFRLHKPGPNAQRDVQGAVELEEIASTNARPPVGYVGSRALTLTLTHTQRVPQGPRHVAMWAPFWIINQTGLPLRFRQHFRQVSSRLVPGTGSRPFMWAFRGGDSGASMDDADQLCIASENTDWSSPFRLDLVGQGRRLDLRVNGGMRAAFSTSKAYEIACKTTRALGRFERVKVTVLLPSIMLVSKCNVPVVYYQATCTDRMAIQPGQKVPFHWPSVKEPRVLCLEVDHEGGRYVSQGFGVEMGVSNFSVKLRMVGGRRIMYIPVVLKQIKSCHVLILGQPVGRLPTTYVIKNLTSHAITVRQDAPGVEAEELGPHVQVAYGWDCLLADPKRLVVTFPGIPTATGMGRQEVYELDTLNTYVPVEYRRYFYIQTPSGLVLQPTQTPDGKTFIRLKARNSAQRDLQLWYMDRQTIRLKATDDLLLPLHGRVEEYTQLVLGDEQQLLAECWVLRPGGQVVSAQAWHMAWQVETDQPGSVVRIMPASCDPRQRFVLNYVTPGTGKITAKVLAEGPVRVLRLADVEPQVGDESIDFRGVNLALSGDSTERLQLQVKVGLSSGLCISLIDDRPVEVGNVVLRAIELRYTDTDLHRQLKVRIASLQVDNQLFADPKRLRPGIHSVVVAPLPDERRRPGKKRGSGSGSMLSLTSQKDPELETAYFEFFGKVSKESTADVLIVRDINMAVQNFNVFLEEEFFYRMANLFTVLLARQDDGRALVSVDPLQEIEKQFENTGRARLYVERLEVAPVDFYISIIRSGGLPADLQVLGELQGLPLVTINYLQLRLARVRLHHAFDDPLAVFHRIRRQYKTQLLSQWYKGIAHGLSVAARAVTSTLADWTLDEDYQRDRVRRKEEARADSPGAQFASGVKGLFGGVASGLTGIVEKPIRGFAEEGVEGLLKGVGKGLVGVVMKPVGGVSDFMVETGSAVHSGTTAPRIVAQVVRLARWIPPDKVLVPYDEYAAVGQRMLWSLLALHSKDPPGPREEVYQMHVWLNPGSTATALWPVDPPRNPGHCLLVSTRHIIEFFVQTDGDKRYYEIQSMHPMSRVVSACATSPPPGGLRITLAPPSSPALPNQVSRLGHTRSASGSGATGRELYVGRAGGWNRVGADTLPQGASWGAGACGCGVAKWVGHIAAAAERAHRCAVHTAHGQPDGGSGAHH